MDEGYTFEANRASAFLSLMANEGRLRVFELITRKEWDVGSLAEEVKLSQSALSQHLKKLRDAKMVHIRRDAQTIYYSCNSEAVTKLLHTLEDIFGENDRQKAAA